jgi:hypothetical protein
MGRSLPAWQPMLWEYSSGLAGLAVAGVIYVAIRLAPLETKRWSRLLLVHIAASLVFSILHVVGMRLLRAGVYAAMGLHYGAWPLDLAYEYPKDVVFYLIGGSIFWVSLRFAGLRRPAPEPAEPASFDIVEGPRIHRVPVREIIAARAAGNYVEFLLEDGRRPLMRTTLARLESVLERHRFLRTHRSWIINPDRLRSISPVGSGDYRIELEAGADAPLSRRFVAAVHQLRAARAAAL